jgi:hypothetical protein
LGGHKVFSELNNKTKNNPIKVWAKDQKRNFTEDDL